MNAKKAKAARRLTREMQRAGLTSGDDLWEHKNVRQYPARTLLGGFFWWGSTLTSSTAVRAKQTTRWAYLMLKRNIRIVGRDRSSLISAARQKRAEFFLSRQSRTMHYDRAKEGVKGKWQQVTIHNSGIQASNDSRTITDSVTS